MVDDVGVSPAAAAHVVEVAAAGAELLLRPELLRGLHAGDAGAALEGAVLEEETTTEDMELKLDSAQGSKLQRMWLVSEDRFFCMDNHILQIMRCFGHNYSVVE